MDKLDSSSTSTYTRNSTTLQHTASLNFSPDKKQEPAARGRKSIAFIMHKCYICNSEGPTKSCKKCRQEVCLNHVLGSNDAYCVECEPKVKSEITREDYKKLLVKAHLEYKQVFTGVEQKRREKAEMAESYAKLEEEIKVKKVAHNSRETQVKKGLGIKVEESSEQLALVEALKEKFDKANSNVEAYKRKIEENRQTISHLINQLDIINQEREIISDQLRESNLKSKEIVNIQKLHRNSCSECQAAIERNFCPERSATDYKKFSIAQEQKIEVKRDLCRCITM